jgi:hypothetical protein
MDIVKGPFSEEPPLEIGWVAIVSEGQGRFVLARELELGFFDRLFGKRHYYQVLIARHTVAFDYDLQSGQATYGFKARLTATANVENPIGAVQNGLRNTASSLRQPIAELLQNAVLRVDYHRVEEARREGVSALRQLRHPVIGLTDIVLSLEPDADAREALRTVEGKALRADAAKIEYEEQKLERDHLLENFGSWEELVALLMTTKEEERRNLLERVIASRTQRDSEQAQRLIEAFRYTIDSGRLEEDEIPAGLRSLLEQLSKAYGSKSASAGLLTGNSSRATGSPGGELGSTEK